jgi:hypothetical protein
MKNKLVFLYPILLFIYSIYSFSQTNPNVVLSSNPVYWSFQQQMWQLGYHVRPVSSLIYALLILGLFGLYLYIVNQVKKNRARLKDVVVIFLLSVLALLPSYPGLSNDIFNYLMNAKMMHEYNASPYEYSAWDFPDEPWLAFMMNVHTTTPYGYVWTGIGYVIYWMTLGDLQFGMLGLRLLAIAATVVITWSIWILSRKNLIPVALFCLNPVVLLEAVSNTHNDITMMAFFMLGLALYSLYYHKNRLFAYLLVALFWLLSVYTKLITVITPAVYLSYIPVKKYLSSKINVYDLLAGSLVVVMYADGSKRFFTWYLLWALPVSVLAKNIFTRYLLVFFSLGGLLSYLPYLYTGEYTQTSAMIRHSLFFAPACIYAIWHIATQLTKKKHL